MTEEQRLRRFITQVSDRLDNPRPFCKEDVEILDIQIANLKKHDGWWNWIKRIFESFGG
jgi:hypothetical protein